MSTARYPELEALNSLRLERDLTYRALARQVGIPLRTLYSLLTDKSPRPYERTLFKIQRFLERESIEVTR